MQPISDMIEPGSFDCPLCSLVKLSEVGSQTHCGLFCEIR